MFMKHEMKSQIDIVRRSLIKWLRNMAGKRILVRITRPDKQTVVAAQAISKYTGTSTYDDASMI